MIAFGGVVVYDVENYLDTRLMQGVDHATELFVLLAGLAPAGIGVVRGEEVQGHVAPVVVVLRVPLVDGHEFHDGDAEVLEVGDLLHEPVEGSGARGIDAGAGVFGKSTDVQLR